jgi:hypothetical protein
MPARISPPLKARGGVSFSPSTVALTTTTVTSSQLTMIARLLGRLGRYRRQADLGVGIIALLTCLSLCSGLQVRARFWSIWYGAPLIVVSQG